MKKGEVGLIHLGDWEEDKSKNQDRDERKAKREQVEKGSDAKSTMFEYGTKEQQEAELKKPRDLPPLMVRERSPKKPFPAPRMSGEKEPTAPSLDAFVETWGGAKRRAAVKALIVKADKEPKHFGTRHGTKDPKGSLARIQRFKTDEGDVIKPPKKKAKRREMASEMIAHHHHHLGRHPGGRAQAIAIGLRQAGMSRTEKAMDIDKGYVGFKKLKQQIAARGGVDNPAAVAASIGRKKYGKQAFQEMASRGETAPERAKRKKKGKVSKGDPGGMSGYEKGVEMYGKEGMQKMATGHITAGEMKDKATPIHLPAAKSVGEKEKGARLMPDVGPAMKALKALGKQEGEEFVSKDEPEKSMNKQIGGGPSVGGGVASTGMGSGGVGSPSVGAGNKSVEKGTGDQEKAYLGEWTPQGFTGSGAAPKGYKPGTGQAVGEAAAEKMSPSDPKQATSMGGPAMKVSGAKPAQTSTKVATSGGGVSGGGGPQVLTSAGASPPPTPKEALKPGSTLTMTSVAGDKAKKVASVNKGQKIEEGTVVPMASLGFGKSLQEWLMNKTGINDLMEKSVVCHGGKGPAKTGAGTPHPPNKGPAKTGSVTDDEDNYPGKKPTSKSVGTVHGGKGPAQTGKGSPHPPNKGPAKTGLGTPHSPARDEGMNKAMTARGIPRVSRAMAMNMDTWRSATNVLTRTNAMLAPQGFPVAELAEPAVDAGGRPTTHESVYKSDLSNCPLCGRTFSKSHGECPSCSMNKALSCKSCGGHMVKEHGGMRCSACGMPAGN